MRALGMIRSGAGVIHYDPWQYWQYEYEANPKGYYAGVNSKFAPGVKVCMICDNYKWSASNRVTSNGRCKECLACLAEVVEQQAAQVPSDPSKNPARSPTTRLATRKALLPETILRRRYQTMMHNERMTELARMPKRINLLSTKQVIDEKLALTAVGSKSL